MIERACDGENAFDVIVAHSFFGLEFYVRKLAKHGVRLVSITQEPGDDPAQVMMRQVIALFDEYQSKENAKHVLRSMKENARQGYWNGARPPFGYTAIEVERRGARIKKRLAIDPVEAETVRLIFKLFLEGDQGSGPMGIKSITVWLNEHGYRTRGGATWAIGPVHTLLSHSVYGSRMRFNHSDAAATDARAKLSMSSPRSRRSLSRRCSPGAGPAEGARSARDAAASGQRSHPADRLGRVRELSWRHDLAHRHIQERPGASLLRLLHLRPAR